MNNNNKGNDEIDISKIDSSKIDSIVESLNLLYTILGFIFFSLLHLTDL